MILGSVADRLAIERAVDGADVVCHLAALMPSVDNARLFETNVGGTFNVAEAITAATTPTRLVFASTDAVYGTGWGRIAYHEPIAEDTPPAPANFYGATKVLAEQLLRQYRLLHGLDFVALRFSWIMGPGEILDLFEPDTWADVLDEETVRRLSSRSSVPLLRQADGQSFRDHVVASTDAARAVIAAASGAGAAGETFNVAGPAPFAYEQWVPIVADRLQRPIVDVIAPGLHAYELSIERARTQLSYEPALGVEAMIESALAGGGDGA